MKQLFGKLVCRFMGHKRGRITGAHSEGTGQVNRYACPRCGATWTRKIRAKKAPA